MKARAPGVKVPRLGVFAWPGPGAPHGVPAVAVGGAMDALVVHVGPRDGRGERRGGGQAGEERKRAWRSKKEAVMRSHDAGIGLQGRRHERV